MHGLISINVFNPGDQTHFPMIFLTLNIYLLKFSMNSGQISRESNELDIVDKINYITEQIDLKFNSYQAVIFMLLFVKNCARNDIRNLIFSLKPETSILHSMIQHLLKICKEMRVPDFLSKLIINKCLNKYDDGNKIYILILKSILDSNGINILELSKAITECRLAEKYEALERINFYLNIKFLDNLILLVSECNFILQKYDFDDNCVLLILCFYGLLTLVYLKSALVEKAACHIKKLFEKSNNEKNHSVEVLEITPTVKLYQYQEYVLEDKLKDWSTAEKEFKYIQASNNHIFDLFSGFFSLIAIYVFVSFNENTSEHHAREVLQITTGLADSVSTLVEINQGIFGKKSLPSILYNHFDPKITLGISDKDQSE